MEMKWVRESTEWTNEKHLDFIEDYRKCEVLWDVRNSNYKNNKVKRHVLLGLAQKYDSDEEIIKKKIKNLRTAFHREHNRLTYKKTGSSTKKWFAYDSLQFILDVTEPRPRKPSTIFQNDSKIEENIETDLHFPMTLQGNVSEYVEAHMSSPSTSFTSTSQDCVHEDQIRKKKKRFSNLISQTENERRAEEAYNIMKNAGKRDDCSIYGEHVGNELRKLSPKAQMYVKHIINNTLFQAALGVYDNEQVTHQASVSSTPNTELPNIGQCNADATGVPLKEEQDLPSSPSKLTSSMEKRIKVENEGDVENFTIDSNNSNSFP